MKKTLIVSLLVSAVVAFLVSGARVPSAAPTLGGDVHNHLEDFSEGISVDGTTVIDGSGNFTVAGTSAFTGELRAPLIQTGSVTSIASGSVHLTAAQICDSSVVRQNISGAPASSQLATFPTAAALIADCLPTNGDSKTLFYQNTSNDALERITLTANTGIDIFVASGSATGGSGKTLDRKDGMLVRFVKVSTSSISAIFMKAEDTD